MTQNFVKVSQEHKHIIVKNAGGLRGPAGPKGDTGAGLEIKGTVDTYAELPTNLTPQDAGFAYLVTADGKLYIWDGTQFPANGDGAQFEGPQGPRGSDGRDGAAATISVGTTTTLPAGQSATVENVGTSSSAVFNFGIPKGDPAEQPEVQKTASGKVITISDAGDSIKSLNKISGDTEQDSYSGKNLVPIYVVSGGNYGIEATYNATTGLVGLTGTGTASWANPFDTTSPASIPAGTYTFSISEASNLQINLRMRIDNANKDYIMPVGQTSVTFTTTGTATNCYVWLSETNGTTVDWSGYIQLEVGSSTSSFEPYVGGTASPNPDYPQTVKSVSGVQTITVTDGSNQSQTTTVDLGSIELCKIGNKQDYIYYSSGKWYLHKETIKIDMSALTGWSKNGEIGFYKGGIGTDYGVAIGQVFSNTFGYSSTVWALNNKIGITSSGNLWITFDGASSVSAANLPTWLGSKGAIIYCMLTTPTDTQITDAALISQLNTLGSADLYAGDSVITVTATSPDLPGSLDITYWTWYKGSKGEPAEITDGSITTAKLADGAVTTDKIDWTTIEYSTTPKVVGKWIDGQDIYQVVVTGTTAAAAYTEFDPNLPTSCIVLNIRGMLLPVSGDTNNTVQTFNRVVPDNITTYGIGVGDIRYNRMLLQHPASGYQNRPFFLVVEYKLS